MLTLTGLSSGSAPILSLVISPSVPLENEIAIDDNAHRKSRTDGQRRLNIEAATDNLLAGLIQRVRCSVPQCLDNCTIIAIGVGACTKLGSDSKQRRQGSSFEQFAPMVVDFVFEAGISCRVCRLIMPNGRSIVLEPSSESFSNASCGPDATAAGLIGAADGCCACAVVHTNAQTSAAAMRFWAAFITVCSR